MSMVHAAGNSTRAVAQSHAESLERTANLKAGGTMMPLAFESFEANNPQQSWGFEGEPPEAVIKDFGTRDGTS